MNPSAANGMLVLSGSDTLVVGNGTHLDFDGGGNTTGTGDTIDFIVDCRDNNNSDSYAWSPTLHAAAGTTWSASGDFAGAPAPKLSPWEKYTQVLLESNEFVYVD